MGKDSRKSGAFDSGMRGKEKATSKGAKGSEAAQKPHGQVGDADGVNLSAYGSGMRGAEPVPVPSPVAPATSVGASIPDPTLEQHTTGAYELGKDGMSTENAAEQTAPTVHEDDQHINIRVPKSMLGKKHA